MYVEFDKIDSNLIVHLIGELDHHSAQEVRHKIDDIIDKDAIKNLVLDFSSVTFMDSSGIGVVIGRYKRMSSKNGQIAITSINNSIKRVFELSGIFRIIKTYDKIEDALNFS